MKLSPLHLTDYFITELHFTANAKFDPKQEVIIQPDDFQIAVEAQPAKGDNHRWQVVLKLQHQPAAEANVPCRLTVEIIGSFLVMEGVPDDRIKRLVETNGPSILYGIAREIVRDTSTRGPYPPVMLPSTSFYKPESQAAPVTPSAPPPLSAAATEQIAVPETVEPAKPAVTKRVKRKTTGN